MSSRELHRWVRRSLPALLGCAAVTLGLAAPVHARGRRGGQPRPAPAAAAPAAASPESRSAAGEAAALHEQAKQLAEQRVANEQQSTGRPTSAAPAKFVQADDGGLRGDATPAPAPAAGHWLDEPPKAAATPAARPLGQGILLLTVAGMAAAGGAVWQRRRPQSNAPEGQDRIDLLAIRSLGGKQRLALVEVSGERLLLAACEQEITLLSHLAAGEAAEARDSAEVVRAQAQQAPGQHQALQASGGEDSTFSTVLADRLPATPVANAAQQRPSGEPQAMPAQVYSADLAGLRAWRAGNVAGSPRAVERS